jgi:dsRNA-specific ribonuclease
MATKDAAFRAYARLYEAGLINQNLLPTALPDPLVLVGEDETEGKENILSVRGRISPWTCPTGHGESVYRKILTVRVQFSESEQPSQLYLLVPAAVDISMAFKLFWTVEQSITVDIRSERLAGDVLQDQEFQRLAVLSTQLLLESVFLKKMQRGSEVPQASLFLAVPFLETKSLQKWLSDCTGDTPITKFDGLRPEQELIRIKWWPKDERPYIFRSLELRCREPYWINPSDPPQPAIEEIHFEVKRLPKRLDYLHPPNSKRFGTAVEFVPAAECHLDRLPPSYAKFMLLLPSILHKIEIRLVATALRQNLLSSVSFRGLGLVEHAICASAANEGSNYQRLELIGDSILKFWTSAQLCAQFPSWHEGYLSKGKDRLVNNFHLRRAARDQGLDEYIHTVPLAGSQWRPPVVELGLIEPASSAQRDMSSKVLADVVEALIGASFLDGEDDQERNIKVKACLTTFLVSVAWRSPAENASILEDLVPRESREYSDFRLLTEVTDFSFEKIVLLIQALTHPSHPPVGIQGTYQRLEFLGDSILDFIVVETMARHSRQIPHFTMHLIRSAVVNAHLLAFYCLGTGLEQGCTKVTTEAGSRSVDILTTRKKTYLWEYMKHSGKLELVTAQKACAKRFDKLSLSIDAALGHGRSHPWHLLLSLNAAKFFSDIIESILGAIFIDSKGNLEACKNFLRRLGLLGYLHRIMAENIDVMHPKERLGMLAGNSKVGYVVDKSAVDNTAQYSCTVLVDDEPTAVSAGEVNKAAAEARAAEEAIAVIVKEMENTKPAEKVDGGEGQ